MQEPDLPGIELSHRRAVQRGGRSLMRPSAKASARELLAVVPGCAVTLAVVAQLYEQVTWLVEGEGESLPGAVVDEALQNVLDASAAVVFALDRVLHKLWMPDEHAAAMWTTQAIGAAAQFVSEAEPGEPAPDTGSAGFRSSVLVADAAAAALLAPAHLPAEVSSLAATALGHTLVVVLAAESALSATPTDPDGD